MKKSLRILLPLAGVLAAGCAQREMEAPQPADQAVTHVVHFTTETTDTRTAFGEQDGTSYPTFWTENDSQIVISVNYGKIQTSTVTPSSTGLSATFDAVITEGTDKAPYSFYIVSPASAVNAISPSRESWNVHIPAVQTPLATSCDEAAQIMVAATDPSEEIPDSRTVKFHHLTAYARMTLKNVDKALETVGYTDANLVSIDVKADSCAIAGDWYVAVADGTLTQKDPSYTITLTPEGVSDLSNIADLWFGLIPVDMSEKPLTVRINTDKGSIERTVTFPANRPFDAGKVAKFTVNMEGATIATTTTQVGEIVYKLVTSLDDLEQYDDLVMVNSATNPAYILGSESSTSGIEGLAKGDDVFTVGDDGHIRIPSSSSASILYIYSIADGEVCFVDNGALGTSTSGRTPYLTWLSSVFTWTVSINTSGAATISYKSGNSTYYIRCNTVTGLFMTTTSSNTVALYKKTVVYHDEVTENPVCDANDPVLQYSEYGAYLTDGNSQTYSRTADQLSREYGSSTVSFALLTPSADKVLEFTGIPAGATKDHSFTLTVCRTENNSVAYFKQFDVIVVQEDGPKLWLSDGNGNGFIVKK